MLCLTDYKSLSEKTLNKSLKYNYAKSPFYLFKSLVYIWNLKVLRGLLCDQFID